MSQHITDPVRVGMDVHQDSITAAILFGNNPEPQVERLPGDLNAVRRMFHRLSKHGFPRSCYEASGAGYVLQRALEHDGFHCEVIAPSLVPKKPGDRRKTDRLDAIHLAHHYRAGNLVSITVPSREQEEIRQLVRSRFAVQSHVVRMKHRIVRVLATHGHRFTEGKSNWTQKHRTWLRKLHRELEGSLQTVLAFHLEHLEYLEAQKNALEMEIDRYSRSEPFRDKVEVLCCFRGVKTLTAMTILTELGDIKRFKKATGLMAFAGLVPSERSSGNVQRRGRITGTEKDFGRGVVALSEASDFGSDPPAQTHGPEPAGGRHCHQGSAPATENVLEDRNPQAPVYSGHGRGQRTVRVPLECLLGPGKSGGLSQKNGEETRGVGDPLFKYVAWLVLTHDVRPRQTRTEKMECGN